MKNIAQAEVFTKQSHPQTDLTHNDPICTILFKIERRNFLKGR
jgi:hypothetical protein